jgi:hypothetical protein
MAAGTGPAIEDTPTPPVVMAAQSPSLGPYDHDLRRQFSMDLRSEGPPCGPNGRTSDQVHGGRLKFWS